MVIIGRDFTFSLEMEDTELVNQPVEEAAYWSRLSLLAATLVINIVTVVVLKRKEDSPINRLIICDCYINILTMFTACLPFRNLNNAYLCSIWMFFNVTLSLWNRLVPVGIVVFRYHLVCIPVQCSPVK